MSVARRADGAGASREYPTLWAAIESIARRLALCRRRCRTVKQAKIHAGARPGASTTEAQRIKDLKREVNELRRANQILKLPIAFFAQAELDRRLK